jgi:hypothetical protein
MSKALKTCLIWGLLLGISFPATARQTSRRKGNPELKVTLLVYDYAGLQADLLSRALEQTKVIFADAGVVVAPTLCTKGKTAEICHGPLAPLEILLRLVPKSTPGTDCEALGYASGPYITVNYSRLKEVVGHSGGFLDKILGCVVAHELGHVLLGPNSHSAEGIMAACISDRELRLIRMTFIGFVPFQKERIRAYVISEARELEAGSVAPAQRSPASLPEPL